MNPDDVVATTRTWVETVVVGLNLCPFAKAELAQDRVRFQATAAFTEDQLLTVLQAELELLGKSTSVETTLLIHPNALADFDAYNQFLGDADRLLVDMELEGVVQVASFHPDYQFVDTDVDDAENYTNRSPYPMLHLLREDSLDRAIDSHPDVDQIPPRNIARMNSLGRERMLAMLQACFRTPPD